MAYSEVRNQSTPGRVQQQPVLQAEPPKFSLPAKPTPAASSATSGFFQAKPTLANQYHEDSAYRRTLDFYLPSKVRAEVAAPFAKLADTVISPQVLYWLRDAEYHTPTLVLRDSFGSPRNELVTSEGWRQLQDFGLREGTVATGYENAYGVHTRLVQFTKMHLFHGSSSTVTCPSAMQDGAAKLIRSYLKKGRASPEMRPILESAYTRLTSRDPAFAWTSGQWMTERTGGSDVSGTETRATLLSDSEISSAGSVTASDGNPLGPWSIDGFKWFSSATDANMCFFLAKTPNSDRVSLFFAPVRRTKDGSTETEFNGIHPQRLKNKLGTKALPTAELELKGLRAYMLGKEGAGTKEISPILNITRVYNAVSSVGSMGRGLAISRAFARVRRVAGGRNLMDMPAHNRSLAQRHVDYRGHNMIVYFVVYLLGLTEQDKLPSQPVHLLASPEWCTHLFRLLTPVVKAMSALSAVEITRYCMESMGGVGYLENEDIELNIAKLHRDTNVLAIWEGTTDVLAADVVRVVKGPGGQQALEALRLWTQSIISQHAGAVGLDLQKVTSTVSELIKSVESQSPAELLYRGRDTLDSINWAVVVTLLVADAARDGDALAKEVAMRWLALRDEATARTLAARGWKEQAALDRAIVYGGEADKDRARI